MFTIVYKLDHNSKDYITKALPLIASYLDIPVCAIDISLLDGCSAENKRHCLVIDFLYLKKNNCSIPSENKIHGLMTGIQMGKNL